MVTVPIKPLSVNECWQGRRFKTKKYLLYEQNMMKMLIALKLPPTPYRVNYEFGLSNSMADVDNLIKPATDILQKRYNFNDRDIYEMNVKKVKVKKGEEYIKFEITTL